MRMSYDIDQKCMKPMGGKPPEDYEECMQARLCRPMIAKPSISQPQPQHFLCQFQAKMTTNGDSACSEH